MVDYAELIPVPDKSTFNVGLSSAGNARMLELFGHPVKNAAYSADGSCTAVNNATFKKLLATRNVGPFAATGLMPALDSLKAIMARVSNEVPDLHAMLATDGMLCARFTKIKQPDGTIKIGPNISNHSWGTALDIRLKTKSDKQGDGKTLRGLLVLSAYFNAANWYWGAAFATEDSMHFEVSRSLLKTWRDEGLI